MKKTEKKISFAVLGMGIFMVLVAIGIIALAINYHSSAVIDAAYPTINSMSCDATEGTEYHVHTLLLIYMNGKQVQVPQDIGVAPNESCLYWLHTHDTTGIIHIEAPKKITPTLGDFLAIWKQAFPHLHYLSQLDNNTSWQVYVNGETYTKSLTTVSLKPHTIITLLYNSPNIKPVNTYNWKNL